MFRQSLGLATFGVVLCGGVLCSAVVAGTADRKSKSRDSVKVQVEDLHPFSHIALIPAGSDLKSIRFEDVKAVEVLTQIRYTMDTRSCAEITYRDPGGSMFCPSSRLETPARAYVVSYSYRGVPLASDEYAADRFTFEVYFQPDELTPEVRTAIAAGNLSRADMAGYFTVRTSRVPEQQLAIDPAQSHLCDRVLKDGIPTRADKSCQDQTRFKTVTAASDYLTVRVDPVSVH